MRLFVERDSCVTNVLIKTHEEHHVPSCLLAHTPFNVFLLSLHARLFIFLGPCGHVCSWLYTWACVSTVSFWHIESNKYIYYFSFLILEFVGVDLSLKTCGLVKCMKTHGGFAKSSQKDFCPNLCILLCPS